MGTRILLAVAGLADEAVVEPPQIFGALVGQRFSENSGSPTYDASVGFTGDDIVYSLFVGHAGVSIHSSTGVVTVDTATSGLLQAFALTVRASNAGGFANQNLTLSIEDADTTLWVAAVTTPPTMARRFLMDTMIIGLKADGVFPKLDWLWVIGADSQASLVDIVDPAKSAVIVGGVTFTADRHFVGNATTGRISAGELPAAAPNLFSVNSACVFVWCNQDNGAGTTPHAGVATSGRLLLNARDSSGNETFQVSDTSDTFQANTGSRLGFRCGVREGASIKRGYKDGTLVSDLATAATTLPAGDLVWGGNLTTYSPDGICAGGSGSKLTAFEVEDLDKHLRIYLTAIGAI